MNRKNLTYATIAVVVIALIVGVALASRVPKAATNGPTESAKIKAGDAAPPFSVPTNGGTFDLAAVSTPVLLEVFATWCPHCQRETAVLNDLAKRYAGKVAIVAVSGSPYGLDGSRPETQEDVNQFGAQYKVAYPIAFDQSLDVARKYLQKGYPTLVLIDAHKKIRWINDGEIPEADITKQLNAVLK